MQCCTVGKGALALSPMLQVQVMVVANERGSQDVWRSSGGEEWLVNHVRAKSVPEFQRFYHLYFNRFQ
jgi:hypothetical protein